MKQKVEQVADLSGISFSVKEWQNLPQTPGVYRFYNKRGEVLYVGKAKQLYKRVGSYFQRTESLSKKTQYMVHETAYIIYTEVHTESDALLLENNLIKRHQPKYNILLRDDKSYSYVHITDDRFSRLLMSRQRTAQTDAYIGPYTNERVVKNLLEVLRRLYKIRTCTYHLSEENIRKKKYKVCLAYHIGNCLGPCEGRQTLSNYKKNLSEAVQVLKGRIYIVRKHLKKAIQLTSSKLEFEQAYVLRQRLQALEKLHQHSIVANPALGNVEVCTALKDEKHIFINYMQISQGMATVSETLRAKQQVEESDEEILITVLTHMRRKYRSSVKQVLTNIAVKTWKGNLQIICPRQGDKQKLVNLSIQNASIAQEKYHRNTRIGMRNEKVLRALQRELHLQAIPRHIECFDISNLQSSGIVGAVTCFKNGKPCKDEYRHFHIQTVQYKPNDYAAMREVVTRRYQRLLEEGRRMPTLVIIDGGKGQLSVAHQALKALKLHNTLPIIGIAKRLEDIFIPNLHAPLQVSASTLLFMQKIRNETHRYVVNFHRLTRDKNSFKSRLLSIKGVGEATHSALFREFSSIKELKNSSVDHLSKIIGVRRAKLIHTAIGKYHSPSPNIPKADSQSL